MSRVTFSLDDIRDAASLAQAAEHLATGDDFVLVFDGGKVVFLPGQLAREGFTRSVLIDCITPGAGLP